MLPTLHIVPDEASLAEAASRALVERIAAGLSGKTTFRLALTGGKTPKNHYKQLSQLDFGGRVDWRRVEVFWGDERCVPPGDPESNYRMAHEALLAHVPVRAEAVHRIEGELAPEEAATRYEAVIGHEPLDLLQLGMGDDGHVASLFPGGPWLDERDRWVVTSRASYPPYDRVTLTLPALNAAAEVHFLVAGAAKAVRVAEVLREVRTDRPTLPAARIRPAGPVHWFLDRAAASQLLREV